MQAGEWGWIQNKKRLPHRMGRRLSECDYMVWMQ
nr:MAG TPA: hypothetical protein [Caudoviricetes sp.]